MDFRLLIDLEAIEILDGLRSGIQHLICGPSSVLRRPQSLVRSPVVPWSFLFAFSPGRDVLPRVRPHRQARPSPYTLWHLSFNISE